jgi:hypothetical protein
MIFGKLSANQRMPCFLLMNELINRTLCKKSQKHFKKISANRETKAHEIRLKLIPFKYAKKIGTKQMGVN